MKIIDKLKRKMYMRKYRKTKKWKQYAKRYNSSEKRRKYMRKYMREYKKGDSDVDGKGKGDTG